MLTLSKKTDYALIAIAYLAERPEKIASAREIAEAYNLPLALLMNILKLLHHRRVLKSTRGTKGGYQLMVSPHSLSLHDLVEMIDGPIHLTECVLLARQCQSPEECARVQRCKVKPSCPLRGSMRQINDRLARMLKDVKIADLIFAARKQEPVALAASS